MWGCNGHNLLVTATSWSSDKDKDMSKRKAKTKAEVEVEVEVMSEEEVKDIQEKFRVAVDASDVEEVALALFNHRELLRAPEYVHVNVEEVGKEYINMEGEDDVMSRALEVMKEWKSSLVIGDTIDMYRREELKWYAAKIIAKDGDVFSLHYDGWGAKYDDHGLLFAHCMMYPRGTAVKKKKKVVKKEKLVTYEFLEVKNEPINPSVIVEEDKSVRRANAARNVVPEVEKRPVVKKRKTKEEEDYEDSMRREWVCSVCYQLEAPDESDLILCDGLCKRSFHLMCLNLSEEEGAKMLADDSEWWCDECKAGRHTCFICGDEGEDHEDVIMCSQTNCGKFYHYNCITSQSAPYTLKNKAMRVPDSTDNVANGSSGTCASVTAGDIDEISSPKKRSAKAPSRFRDDDEEEVALTEGFAKKKKEHGFAQFELKCPSHFCDTCHNLYGPDKPPQYGHGKFHSLHKCFRCPRAFHLNCIPPTSRQNPHALLCPDHPHEVLPTFEPMSVSDVVVENSLQNGAFNQLWQQMILPLRAPCSDKIADKDHFRIPSAFQEEVNSHPPTFKVIWKNDYDALSKNEMEEDYPPGVVAPKVQIPLHISDEMCECHEKCDERCLNRISKIECYEQNKKDTICNVGKECGNRHFSNREYVKVQPFQEYGMGWGLKAKEDVAAGSLVIEYIGEIITEAQMSRRMILQTELTPNDHDFYIMELSSGLFVDGKKKGNLSRFINHACDPNCELVRWIVKGRTRIGIFAIKDIKEDEPLSYDYQFDTQEADTFRCACGAAKCRGTMAPKKKVLSKESLSKKDVKRMVAAGKRRENNDYLVDEAWKRSYTGKLLPGDGIQEIRNGPPRNNFGRARELKVFLPRNTNHGSNFSDRRKLMWLKADQADSQSSTSSGSDR